jgi:probable rRNA maturation factor
MKPTKQGKLLLTIMKKKIMSNKRSNASFLRDSKLSVFIDIRDSEWNSIISNVQTLCVRAAQTAFSLARSNIKRGEASVVLADDKFVKNLNLRYRGLNKSTNVLAFASLDSRDPSFGLSTVQLGDIVICREVTVAEARTEDKTVTNHVCHLVVHGMLHLLGFDHLEEEDIAKMEALETACLELLDIPDPYELYRRDFSFE